MGLIQLRNKRVVLEINTCAGKRAFPRATEDGVITMTTFHRQATNTSFNETITHCANALTVW